MLGDANVGCGYLEAGAFTYEAGFKAGAEIAATDLPDVLMVAGDELAFGVIDGLAEAGVDVPGDVFVTGFDGLPQSSWAGYDLTTLVQPTEALVERTLALLGEGDTSRHATAGQEGGVTAPCGALPCFPSERSPNHRPRCR